MIHLNCDYNRGGAKEVIEALINANDEFNAPYGDDEHSKNAEKLIQKACKNNGAKVYFLSGGTQANMTLIRASLRVYEGVLCSNEAHIAGHETGAIEFTGHKVLCLNSEKGVNAGKITAQSIENAVLSHKNDAAIEHMVKPGMVYISQPTELGTVYTEDEIVSIGNICKKYNLKFYVDGARLAYAIAYIEEEYKAKLLQILAKNCSAFTIGGAKCGAVFGEALVIIDDELKNEFKYIVKQGGALMSKGFIIGCQYEALFTNNLYTNIGKHGNQMAKLIEDALNKKSYKLLSISNSNQIFPILPNKLIDLLSKKFNFTVWQKIDSENTAIRFVCSFATKLEDVKQLSSQIDSFMQ